MDYGRASLIQTAVTTKSGSDTFHGFASDYFANQKFQATIHFQSKIAPYHSNHISAGIGGPFIPHYQAFFFFTIEPLRSLTSSNGSFALGSDKTKPADRVKARSLVKRMLAQVPDDPNANGMAGMLDYEDGQWAEAVAHFSKAGETINSQQTALRAEAVSLDHLDRDALGSRMTCRSKTR